MNCDPIHDLEQPTVNRSRNVLVRLATIALLLVVAGFITHAKTCWYYSPSNPVHYLSIASKAKVAHAPADFGYERPWLPVIRSVQAPPVTHSRRPDENEILPIQRISITISLQHRSPPASLA
jgi:hypothetical protein